MNEGSLTSLKDEVVATLENKGILAKFKAQLRASVFSAIEDAESLPENQTVKSVKDTPEGRQALELIREFLTFCRLEHTLAVLVPEANLQSQRTISRDDLASSLQINTRDPRAPQPLLVDLLTTIHRQQAGMKSPSTDKQEQFRRKLNPVKIPPGSPTSPPASPGSPTASPKFNPTVLTRPMSNTPVINRLVISPPSTLNTSENSDIFGASDSFESSFESDKFDITPRSSRGPFSYSKESFPEQRSRNRPISQNPLSEPKKRLTDQPLIPIGRKM